MANVEISLGYDKLSKLIQTEFNNREIKFRHYPISIRALSISSPANKLQVSGQIVSKWNATFQFAAKPEFVSDENKLLLSGLELNFNSSNVIFKGLLNLMKTNIKNRIEQFSNQSMSPYIAPTLLKLDEEISQAPLPFDLCIDSMTKDLVVNSVDFIESEVKVKLKMDQLLKIKFKNEPSSVASDILS